MTLTGNEFFSLDSHASIVKSVAFSPDNSRLVVTNSNGEVLVYTLDVKELTSLAQQRTSGRELTEDERNLYLHEVKKQ